MVLLLTPMGTVAGVLDKIRGGVFPARLGSGRLGRVKTKKKYLISWVGVADI